MRILLANILLLFFLPIGAMAQNVGIGTATPDQKLVVEGGQIKLQNPDGTKFLHVRTDGSEIDITTVGSDFWITATSNKHIILNPTESSHGNIGIGTYNPTEKLDVAGGARIQSLTGTGNRIVYTTSTGILAASQLNISDLEKNNALLQQKVEEQALLIEQLTKRLDQLEAESAKH
ncbi:MULTISPECIES: hypothetical protein [unclassified Aureispira]|uniref:hypothetical protein n=1 Tax=unclassified Aureispira TaxID=2649989 RepID=UPI000696AAEC|nr:MULTISPECIES: hypothetical protein [unclassified Aureispira]WMX17328.1 hypothetical protein QP953_13185 [Aureispira sp. CCB-E]